MTWKAIQNELLLINCYKQHNYYTNTNAHTLWLHFDGNNSRALFKNLIAEKGQKIKCPATTAERFREIIQAIKLNESEAALSKGIYALLCDLSAPNTDNYKRSNAIDTVKKYIADNFDKGIKVEDMARAVNMSTSYFARLFKEATTFSPYEYLLNIRLEKAKELLLKTDYTVYEIAYKTGFNSDANFVYFFIRETGITPLKFRNMQF